MRLLRPLLVSLTLLSSYVAAQDFNAPDVPKQKHNYQVCALSSLHKCNANLLQSDVARMRKIVIDRQVIR